MSLRSEVVRIFNELLAGAKKISELPDATTPLAGTEQLEINQGGVSKKVAVSNVGGGGGSQDLQSVLDAGSTLTGDSEILVGLNIFRETATDGATHYSQRNLSVGSAEMVHSSFDNTQQAVISVEDGILVTDTYANRGLQGQANFSANIQADDYTQKNYVDARDLQNVLDADPEATLDALTVTRFGIELNNDDQERIIQIDEDGPSMKYVNGADTLEVTVRSGDLSIGGSIAGINQSINIGDGITLNTPTIPASDDSFKIATTEWVRRVVIGVQDLFISASAMWPRTTGGCADLAKTEIATSLFNIQSLDFDQTTQEFCQFQIVLPRKWNNGTVTAVFYWTAAAGSGDVQWGISGGAYSNDDALTVAFGTAITVDDTLLATDDLHITAATAAITLAGTPADADFLAFQISRNPASDTLTGDAKLLGVSIRLTTDSAIDA